MGCILEYSMNAQRDAKPYSTILLCFEKPKRDIIPLGWIIYRPLSLLGIFKKQSVLPQHLVHHCHSCTFECQI